MTVPWLINLKRSEIIARLLFLKPENDEKILLLVWKITGLPKSELLTGESIEIGLSGKGLLAIFLNIISKVVPSSSSGSSVIKNELL